MGLEWGGRTYVMDHPCVLQDIGPLGPLPKKKRRKRKEEKEKMKVRKEKDTLFFITTSFFSKPPKEIEIATNKITKIFYILWHFKALMFV